MPEAAATIVVVDDAPEVRRCPDAPPHVGRLEVVGEGADGADAVALAEPHRPALMLLDVSMPGMDGLEALPQVLAASPETRVVMYSGFDEQGLADTAAQLGASAFIEKVGAARRPRSPPARRAGASSRGDPGAGPLGRPEPTHRAARGRRAVDQRSSQEHLERFREVFEEAAIGMATHDA